MNVSIIKREKGSGRRDKSKKGYFKVNWKVYLSMGVSVRTNICIYTFTYI